MNGGQLDHRGPGRVQKKTNKLGTTLKITKLEPLATLKPSGKPRFLDRQQKKTR